MRDFGRGLGREESTWLRDLKSLVGDTDFNMRKNLKVRSKLQGLRVLDSVVSGHGDWGFSIQHS